jgi:hypothetical protein
MEITAIPPRIVFLAIRQIIMPPATPRIPNWAFLQPAPDAILQPQGGNQPAILNTTPVHSRFIQENIGVCGAVAQIAMLIQVITVRLVAPIVTNITKQIWIENIADETDMPITAPHA